MRFVAALALLTPLAACVSAAPDGDRPAAPPRVASFDCGDDGTIRIERAGDIVRIQETPAAAQAGAVAPDPVELTAAPPAQNARYGKDGYALVLEEKLALYMKAGRAPYTCQR